MRFGRWLVAALLAGSVAGFVPAAEVLAAPPGTTACPATRPDEAAAADAAEGCGSRVEIFSQRTEFAQVFANPDGTNTLEESAVPERVRRGNGWVPVDTTLRRSADGKVRAGATLFPLTFSGGGNVPLASIAKGSHSLTMDWPGDLPEPVLAGDTATYRDVLPDVDLRVTASAVGFSEVLIVKTPKAARNPELTTIDFDLKTTGVTAAEARGGGVEARDKAGAVVFVSPTPVMWDATAENSDAPVAQPRAKTAQQAEMPATVTKNRITITPDRKLLTADTTRFPVSIDPSFTGLLSGNAFANVMSKLPSSKFYQKEPLTNGSTTGTLGAGRTRDCDSCSQYTVRSFFRMDIAKARKKEILGAKMIVEQRWSWTCNPKSNAKLWVTGAIGPNTTWNNQPSWDKNRTVTTAANRKLGSAHGCAGPAPIEFNVTSIISKAANDGAGASTITFGLRAVDEGTLNQWKRFNHKSLKLAVDYNSVPNTPNGERKTDGKACATGTSRPYVKTSTPILSVTQSDADGGDQDLSTEFYWWAQGSKRSDAQKVVDTGANPATASKAIPAGKLKDNTTYLWQALTRDKRKPSGFSGICEFTTDLVAPNPPSNLVSEDYPRDSPTQPAKGGVGISGQVTVSPPTVLPEHVVGYTWTLDSGVQAAAANPVKADATTHAATFPIVPKRDGVNVLRIWTKDRAAWYSATPYEYTFKVRPGVGPAAEWLFEEASGAAVDETAHGNALTPSGGVTRTAGRGNVGTALTLNGTNAYATTAATLTTPHPDTGAATPVRTDSSFTVAAWVKLNNVTGAVQVAASSDGTRTAAYTLGFAASDKKWRFTMAGSDKDSPTTYQAVSNAVATAGKWTHLAGVYDVNTKKLTLYVNGAAQTTTATLTGGFASPGKVTVGRRIFNGVLDGYLNGQVDNVRVYNYAVTTDNLVLLTLPVPPAIRLPQGDTVAAGSPLSAEFTSGGDANITKYSYSVGVASLDRSVNATTPGGATGVSVPTSTAGRQDLFAAAVDGSGRRSLVSAVSFVAAGGVSLSGTVYDAETADPAVGATVTLEPGSRTATTDASGGFTFAGLVQGTYTVKANLGGRCGLWADATLTVESEAWVDLPLTRLIDDVGYVCDVQAGTFLAADQTVVPLTGDDAVREVDLPFDFPFYGYTYTSAWIDTNGLLSFGETAVSRPLGSSTLPAPVEPNALVAPFWDDLVVDSSASVRTRTDGTGDTRQFVVEWRNVYRKGNTAQRLSAEAVLRPDGRVSLNYTGLDNDAEKGANAAVGIGAPDGASGLAYSDRKPALVVNQAINFERTDPPAPDEYFDITGVLTDSLTGLPLAGQDLYLDEWVDHGDDWATTDANGRFAFRNLLPGAYRMMGFNDGGVCLRSAHGQADISLGSQVVNLVMRPEEDFYGCQERPAAYVPADDVVLAPGGADTVTIDLPFTFRYWGAEYTSVIADTDRGEAWFPGMTEQRTQWFCHMLCPYGADIVMGSDSSVRTRTTGTAPNRSVLVEWRDFHLKSDPASKFSFAVTLREDGLIAFTWDGVDTEAERSAADVGVTDPVQQVAGVPYQWEGEWAIKPGISAEFVAPPVRKISGTVSVEGSEEPLAGAVVELRPSGRTTTTAADGSYEFDNLHYGFYAVTLADAQHRCAGAEAMAGIWLTGAYDEEAYLTGRAVAGSDGAGTSCTEQSLPFVAADDTVLPLTTARAVTPVDLPFPVTVYGSTYDKAWVDSSGLIRFRAPGEAAPDPAVAHWDPWDSDEEPRGADPQGPDDAVFPFWFGWTYDARSSVRTAVTGTGPNRQYVVEWRDVMGQYLVESRDLPGAGVRVSFEVVFGESGGFSFRYRGLNPNSNWVTGDEGVVGVTAADGVRAFPYLVDATGLSSERSLVFRQDPVAAPPD